MAGLAAARARGRNGGRPTVWTAEKLKVARDMYDSGEHDIATIARVVGVSRASVYRAMAQATLSKSHHEELAGSSRPHDGRSRPVALFARSGVIPAARGSMSPSAFKNRVKRSGRRSGTRVGWAEAGTRVRFRARPRRAPGGGLWCSYYSSSPPCWADFLRSSSQWLSWVSGWRHSRSRYSKPGSSTIGIGSGAAGATAPTTIFASRGMNGDCAGIGAVTISTGSP